MKSRIILALFLVSSMSVAFAQTDKPTKSDSQIKVDESIAKIKKEIENIKKNIDSTKLREISKELGKSAEEIGSSLEDIADDIEEKADKLEEKADNKVDNKDNNSDNKSKDSKAIIKKTDKPSRRTKLYLEFGLGLSGLDAKSTTIPNAPEYQTWGSNYWDLGLKFKTRIGGNSSPAFVTYGLTYLLNSFETTNDIKINMTSGSPVFEKVENAKYTELNIGYLTIPVGLEFKIGRKGKLGIGGFGGYRVRTVQNIGRRIDNENVSEKRKGSNYGLNNLMYGASVKIGVGGLVLNGRYNFSSLFSDKTAYKNQFNIYSVGLSFGF